jgi:putative flippase GtrA
MNSPNNRVQRQTLPKLGPFFRFLLSGVFNTGVTYALYLALLQLIPYHASYSIAFISGIVLAYYFNSKFVFRVKSSVSTATLFPLVYLVQYLTGLGVISMWVELLQWDKVFAPLAAICFTIPLTYLLSKWVFNRKSVRQ